MSKLKPEITLGCPICRTIIDPRLFIDFEGNESSMDPDDCTICPECAQPIVYLGPPGFFRSPTAADVARMKADPDYPILREGALMLRKQHELKYWG